MCVCVSVWVTHGARSVVNVNDLGKRLGPGFVGNDGTWAMKRPKENERTRENERERERERERENDDQGHPFGYVGAR